MVAPSLLEYIQGCVAQGYGLSEIRQVLLNSEWPPAEVEEALAAHANPPPTLSQPKAGNGKKALVATAGSLFCLLLLIGVPVAFAEQGYLPAFSKVYRVSNVSVAWNGLAWKPSLALAEAIKAASSVQAVGFASKNTITISSSSASADSKPGSQLLSKGLALLKVGPSLSRSLASVPVTGSALYATEAADSAPLDYSQYLPLDLSFTLKGRSDQAHNSELSFSLSATQKGKDMFQQFNASLPSSLTLDMLADSAGKKGYYKSNLLPYKTLADQGRWFSYSVPESATENNDSLSAQGEISSLTDSQRRDMQQIADKLFVDQGVERADGRAEAHYRAVVTEASLKNLKQQYPDNSYLKELDLTGISATGILQLDVWIGQADHLPYRLRVADSGPMTVGTETAKFQVATVSDNLFSYSDIQKVIIPATSAVLGSDPFGYAEQACGSEGKAADGSSALCMFAAPLINN